MLKNNFALSALLFSTAVMASAATDSAKLINMAFDNPARPYQGHMIVTSWTEKESKAEDVKIYFSPPNNYRFEFLAPDGSVERVVMSNGSSEQVQVVKNNQVIQNYVTQHKPSLLTPIDEKKLLAENYKPVLKDSEPILGRPALMLELTPLTPGKPHQLMRIDRETKVVLEIKRFTPEGKTGSLTRFTTFEPAPSLSADLFISQLQTVQLDTAKDPLPPANDTAGFLFPTKLYGGFSLEGGDQFEVSGKPIRHMRYTDGLLPVSIFKTPLPVKAPDQKQTFIPWNRPLEMGASRAGNIYQWRKDHDYFTVIGDMQPELLQQIAGTIK